jgi:RNA polymerase sigma-70 factor, ECF subfamily
VAILARPAFLPHLTEPEGPLGREAAIGREVVLGRDSGIHAASVLPVAATLGVCAEKARLTALYVEHGVRIHRFLRDLLGDHALAADATQETFVRAYKKLGEIDVAVRLAPWLFGIARNVSLELRKSRFRAGRHVVMVNGALPEGAAPGSPESDYLGREALQVISAALTQLPEERRAMLLLRLDHGLSYDDIAITMSCSLAKVKVEIFRAREILRKTMAEYEGS